MTRRDRLRQVVSKLRLKDNTNLEWVLTTLEALDDTTAFQVKFRMRNRWKAVVKNG